MARVETPSSFSSHAIADKEQTLIVQIAEQQQQPRRLARSFASIRPFSSRFRTMKKPSVHAVVTPTGSYAFYILSVRFFATCGTRCLSRPFRCSCVFLRDVRSSSRLFATSTSVSSDRDPFLGSLQLFERSRRRSQCALDEIR